MPKIVKFNRQYSIYNPGDVAGFPDVIAVRLIRNEIAAPHDPTPEESSREDPTSQDVGTKVRNRMVIKDEAVTK